MTQEVRAVESESSAPSLLRTRSTCNRPSRPSYQRGCRCLACRLANAQYQQARRALDDAHVVLVAADMAMLHLQQLAAKGVGYRQAARLSGLSIAEIRAVRSGRQTSIRETTQTRILAIRPILAHGTRVKAWDTWRLLYSLKREGYTLGMLAGLIGLRTPVQFDHGQITVRNALRVRRFYDQVNMEGEELAS